jgi:hypothetical protein
MAQRKFKTANERRCTQNGAVARRPPKCDPKDLSACICVHARFHTSSAAPMNETVRHCRDSHRLTGAPGSAGVSTEPHAEWSHRLRMGRRPVIPRPLRGAAPLRGLAVPAASPPCRTESVVCTAAAAPAPAPRPAVNASPLPAPPTAGGARKAEPCAAPSLCSWSRPVCCATCAPDPCAASPIALEPAPLGGAAAW